MNDSEKRLSIFAIVSCVLALGGIAMLTPLGSFAHHGVEETFLKCLILPIAAVICGFIGLRQTRKATGNRGRLFALLALILGVGVVALLFTVMGLRFRAVRHYQVCGKNMKMIENAVCRRVPRRPRKANEVRARTVARGASPRLSRGWHVYS